MRQTVQKKIKMDDRNGAGNNLSRYNNIVFHMVYDLLAYVAAAQLSQALHFYDMQCQFDL